MDTPRHTCPRCAYDLSGVVESWTDSCPLGGVCSECGLTFRWFDVLRGSLRFPGWSFEHARRGRLLATYFPTLLRAVRPARLWAGIRLETRANHGRLLLFVAISCILLRLAGIICIGIPAAAAFYAVGPRWGRAVDWRYAALDLAWPYGGGWWWFGSVFAAWVAMGLLTVLLVPLAYAALPISLRRARVRPSHLLRVQLYTLALLPVLIGSWPVIARLATLLDAVAPSLTVRLGLGWSNEETLKLGLASIAWTAGLTWWLWRAAARDYLRLDRPGAVALATTTIATLAAATLVALVYGPAIAF